MLQIEIERVQYSITREMLIKKECFQCRKSVKSIVTRS